MNRNGSIVPKEQVVSIEGFMPPNLEDFRKLITLPLVLCHSGEFFEVVAFQSLPNTLSLPHNENP